MADSMVVDPAALPAQPGMDDTPNNPIHYDTTELDNKIAVW